MFKANMKKIKYWKNQRREWRSDIHLLASLGDKEWSNKLLVDLRRCTEEAKWKILEQRMIGVMKVVLFNCALGATLYFFSEVIK